MAQQTPITEYRIRFLVLSFIRFKTISKGWDFKISILQSKDKVTLEQSYIVCLFFFFFLFSITVREPPNPETRSCVSEEEKGHKFKCAFTSTLINMTETHLPWFCKSRDWTSQRQYKHIQFSSAQAGLTYLHVTDYGATDMWPQTDPIVIPPCEIQVQFLRRLTRKKKGPFSQGSTIGDTVPETVDTSVYIQTSLYTPRLYATVCTRWWGRRSRQYKICKLCIHSYICLYICTHSFRFEGTKKKTAGKGLGKEFAIKSQKK